ncbi:MAG: ABC transporter substrate-binding protein [Proteobacteria bacterium]|nr:ABC transporter substrate-binding protein [Pseudomonadota bacterium]
MKRLRPLGALLLGLAWVWPTQAQTPGPPPVSAPASAPAAAQAPRLDFAHFWISASERAGLDVIARQFRNRGGVWTESQSLDYEFMKRDSVMRYAAGFPPGALWAGAEDIAIMGSLGMIRPLDAMAAQDQWAGYLYDFIWPILRHKEEVLALPLTLHNENWAWYNAKLYRRLQLPLPRSWDQVLAQAPVFRRAGVMPLAISDQPWNVRLLFSTMMAGAAGPQLYRRLYENEDPAVFDHPRVIRVLNLLGRLRAYRPAPATVKTWDAATALVVGDKAAMQVMGDWAKGEFKQIGVSAQLDYVCAPAPEADGVFVVALDMVGFPRQRQGAQQAGQRLLAKLLLERDLQLEFARRKGSLPVRRDVDATELDACASASLPRLADAAHRLTSPRTTMKESIRIALQAHLFDFWSRPDMTVDELRPLLKAALRK